MFPYGVTVTVERPTGTDRHGNPLEPDTHTESGAFAPAGSTEAAVGSGSSQVEWDEDFLTDLDADIRSQDTLIHDGQRFSVHGRPQKYRNPFTDWRAGMVVRLKAVSG